MQKGLGIAALVISILAVSIPVFGPWFTILAAFLAAFAYGPGLGFAVATIIIDVVNILFLSPTVWMDTAMMAKGVGRGHGQVFIFLGSQLVALIVLIVLHKRRKVPAAAAGTP